MLQLNYLAYSCPEKKDTHNRQTQRGNFVVLVVQLFVTMMPKINIPKTTNKTPYPKKRQNLANENSPSFFLGDGGI